MTNIKTSVTELIGHTPMMELTHIEKELGLQAKIIAKLEYFNATGSVKDRIAKNSSLAHEGCFESINNHYMI